MYSLGIVDICYLPITYPTNISFKAARAVQVNTLAETSDQVHRLPYHFNSLSTASATILRYLRQTVSIKGK